MGRRVAWDSLYSTARWARLRRHQLLEHPLCKFCLERGIVELATICDHVEPHHGDRTAFFTSKLQSLCKPCHELNEKRDRAARLPDRCWS